MKKIIFPLFMLLIFMLACAATGSKDIKSLRGDTEIPAGSNPVVGMDWQPEDSSYDRTFVHQPPLIPHEVVEYSITTAQNDCLDCHGQKDSDAPMPHKSHYMDRDGQTIKSCLHSGISAASVMSGRWMRSHWLKILSRQGKKNVCSMNM